MKFETFEAPYGFYHEPIGHRYILMRELHKEPDGVNMWVCIDKRTLGQIVVEAGTQTRCVQRLIKYLHENGDSRPPNT